VSNTAVVTGGKPIAVLSQSIPGVSAVNFGILVKRMSFGETSEMPLLPLREIKRVWYVCIF
jgi:hypothetical protein